MKNLYIFIILLLASNILKAQNLQNANLYFGEAAGLSFNNGMITELTDMPLSNYDNWYLEGSATISGKNGGLLFYTNGEDVFSYDHQLMENGSGLKGHHSSTQNAVIIPKPLSNSIFYIVTIDGNTGFRRGLNYSEVDLSVNNGKGKVIYKNIPLLTASGGSFYNFNSEKLTVIHNSDGINYWIITQFKDELYTYEVTSSGINTIPVSTYQLTNENLTFTDRGLIKVSPDGTKIVTTCWDTTNINIKYKYGSFNNYTGQISNMTGTITQPPGGGGAVGFEFSPDSQTLYFLTTMGYLNSSLYNYNFSTNSSILVSSQSDELAFDIRRGIDDKLYVCGNGNTVSVVSNPNNYINPGYQYAFMTLSRNIPTGLPQWIYWHNNSIGYCQSLFFVSEPNNNMTYSFNDNITTAGNYTLNSGQNITMFATKYIQIGANTLIKPGAEYLASIKSCIDYRPAETKSIASIKQEVNHEDLKPVIFPNPASESVSIQSVDNLKSISIFSLEGKEIYKNDKIENINFTIPINNFAKGIYIITISTNKGGTFTEKLVIK